MEEPSKRSNSPPSSHRFVNANVAYSIEPHTSATSSPRLIYQSRSRRRANKQKRTWKSFFSIALIVTPSLRVV
jgi:hypothetical protein